MNEQEVHNIRAVMAHELLQYRKRHSAVYGDTMTYHDEEGYLLQTLSFGDSKTRNALGDV